MKLTKETLKQIIKEELDATLREMQDTDHDALIQKLIDPNKNLGKAAAFKIISNYLRTKGKYGNGPYMSELSDYIRQVATEMEQYDRRSALVLNASAADLDNMTPDYQSGPSSNFDGGLDDI